MTDRGFTDRSIDQSITQSINQSIIYSVSRQSRLFQVFGPRHTKQKHATVRISRIQETEKHRNLDNK